MNTVTTTTRTARSIRPLRLAALAVPVAAALTLGAGAAAHADDTFDPELVQVVTLDPGATDPVGPVSPVGPVGPDDLTVDPGDCEQTDTCVDPGDPADPADPGDEDPTVPEGPGDMTTEDDCQQTDTCGGGGDGTDDGDGEGTDEGDETPTDPETPDADSDDSDVEVPTRIDAGSAVEADPGTELSWLLPGGLLVTAAGVAFTARRTRSGREA